MQARQVVLPSETACCLSKRGTRECRAASCSSAYRNRSSRPGIRMWKRFNARLCMQVALGFALRGRPRKHSQQNQVVAPGGRRRLAVPPRGDGCAHATGGTRCDQRADQRHSSIPRQGSGGPHPVGHFSRVGECASDWRRKHAVEEVWDARPRDRGDPGSGVACQGADHDGQHQRNRQRFTGRRHPWCYGGAQERNARHRSRPPSSPTKLACTCSRTSRRTSTPSKSRWTPSRPSAAPNIRVSGGDRVGVPAMVLEAGGVAETVNVSAEALLVQSQSAERSFAVVERADRRPADQPAELHQPPRLRARREDRRCRLHRVRAPRRRRRRTT